MKYDVYQSSSDALVYKMLSMDKYYNFENPIFRTFRTFWPCYISF